jgi:hypothetical protein
MTILMPLLQNFKLRYTVPISRKMMSYKYITITVFSLYVVQYESLDNIYGKTQLQLESYVRSIR